jgi:hypothetical protein
MNATRAIFTRGIALAISGCCVHREQEASDADLRGEQKAARKKIDDAREEQSRTSGVHQIFRASAPAKE